MNERGVAGGTGGDEGAARERSSGRVELLAPGIDPERRVPSWRPIRWCNLC